MNRISVTVNDFYQFSMSYVHWKSGNGDKNAVFDLFFRKNPFGEVTVFSGLNKIIEFLKGFKFTEEELKYLLTKIKDEEYIEYLRNMDLTDVKVEALKEGTLVSSRVPLIKVSGPISKVQLLETPLLNLVGYSTLVSTKAMRIVNVAKGKKLLEFGARRAHSPDSAVISSYAACIGGFDGTSNVKAGETFDLECNGTMAHAFISSFVYAVYEGITKGKYLIEDKKTKEKVDLYDLVNEYLDKMPLVFQSANKSELEAFMCYATIYPDSFLAIVDTFGTLRSGIYNFILVAKALKKLGYSPKGIRLDSGDLAYTSTKCRELLDNHDLSNALIVASNDLDESVIKALEDQGNSIDVYGVGTNLVNPKTSLGCVYKMVEYNGRMTTKLSDTQSKITIPGSKQVIRIYSTEGYPYVDLMVIDSEVDTLMSKEKVMCKHPFSESKRFIIKPSKMEKLLVTVWDSELKYELPRLTETKEYLRSQLSIFRKDHLREVNPTPFKVSISESLKEAFSELIQEMTPVPLIE